MSDITLFIVEGASTEPTILNVIKRMFPELENSARLIFGTDIYQLYNAINAEDGFSNVVDVMRELSVKNAKVLEGVNESDVASIVLFFDYDGHAPKATPIKMQEMLNFFSPENNAETDCGVLYVSYPMVEAIRHLQSNLCFSTVCAKVEDLSSYKKCIGDLPEKTYTNLGYLCINGWKTLVQAHAKKANLLAVGQFSYPTSIDLLQQASLFEKQLSDHLSVNHEVAVLSAFPMFLIDYYGLAKFS